MTNAIAKLHPDKDSTTVEVFSLVPHSFAEAKEIAQFLAQADMVPKDYRGKPANVLIAIQMGLEVGLAPLQALQNIACINGRPGLWGDAMLALCQSDPTCLDILETFDESAMTASCEVQRNGKAPLVRTFSKADAELAKLWKKEGPWTNYPKRMLQLRARGFALRDSYAAKLRGLQMAEELQDIPVRDAQTGRASTRPSGAVVDVGAPREEAPPQEREPDATLDDLQVTIATIEAAASEESLAEIVATPYVKSLTKGSTQRLAVVAAYKARIAELQRGQEPPWDAIEQSATAEREINREPGADG